MFNIGKIKLSNRLKFREDEEIAKLVVEGKNFKTHSNEFFVEDKDSNYFSASIRYMNGACAFPIKKDASLYFGSLIFTTNLTPEIISYTYYLKDNYVVETHEEKSIEELKEIYSRFLNLKCLF